MSHPLAGRKQKPEHVAARVVAIRAGKGFQLAAAVEASAELRRGKPLPDAQRAKIAAGLLGNTNTLGHVASAETRAKQSVAMQGKSTAWLTGRKLSEAQRRKQSAYWAANPEKHNFYVDGKGAERAKAKTLARGQIDYRLWREAVFRRDNWTCVNCGVAASGHLQADHIKAWSRFPELRYDVSNGQTLCKPCHLKMPTHGCGSHLTMSLADI